MAEDLDMELCQEMADLVEKLTHSGKTTLDQETMKKFKKICKKSDAYIKQAYHLLMTEVEKNHAEIRLSAFQMISELFHRSHCFRQLILADMQFLMELTLEVNYDMPLPPPKPAAKLLKSQAVEAIHQWQQKFGDTYKTLSLGYNYLKNCKKVDFENMSSQTLAERKHIEEQNQRKEAMKREKLNNTVQEMMDSKAEIREILTQVENCLLLLLPDPESFHIPGLLSPSPHRGSLHISHPLSPSVSGIVSPNPHNKGNPANQDNHNSSLSSLSPEGPVSSPFKQNESSVGDIINVTVKKEPQDGFSEAENKSNICPTCGQVKVIPKKGTRTKMSSKSKTALCPDCKNVVPHGKGGVEEQLRRLGNDNVEVKKEKDSCEESSNVQENMGIDTSAIKSDHENMGIDTSAINSDHENMGIDTSAIKPDPDGPQNMHNQNKTDYSADESKVEAQNCVKSNGTNKESSHSSHRESTDRTRTESQSSVKTEEDSVEEFEEMTDTEEEEDEGRVGEEEGGEDLVRQHGLGSKTYTINIEVPGEVHLQETSDNTDILHNLKDLVGLLSKKYQPMVQRWLEIFAKTGADQKTVRKAIDIKNSLQLMKDKVTQLKVNKMAAKTKSDPVKTEDDNSDDDDDDFEDVPEKEGYEPDIPEHLREEYEILSRPPVQPTERSWKMPKPTASKGEIDPTTMNATLMKMMENIKKKRNMGKSQSLPSSSAVQPSASSSASHDSKLQQVAPVVPYGTDLYHWEDDKIETPILVRYDSEHRFWTPKDNEEIVDKAALASMKTRMINFTGTFQPVRWTCRAPLNSGKLCPRRDRFKCPFHGKIIPRNELGQPVKEEDALDLIKAQERMQEAGPAEWEDPDLQAAIQVAKGIDLSKKSKKKVTRKHPGLTNINKKSTTTKDRLGKKVFNKRAMKRVNEALDKIASKKVKDKFGNNFNYAFPK